MKQLTAAIITLGMLAMLGACVAQELPPKENAHPFAITLTEFKAQALPHTTRAFLVDVDGEGMQGMLVIGELYNMTRTEYHVYFLYEGQLRSGRAGTYPSVDANNRLIAHSRGNNNASYSFYSVFDHQLFVTRSLSGGFDDREGHDLHFFIEWNGEGYDQHNITPQEFERMRTEFGLDHIREPGWWETHPNQYAEILAMTLPEESP